MLRGINAELLQAASEARQSSIATVRYLLSLGANPNVQDSVGRTPLVLALQQDALQLCKLLLVYQADPLTCLDNPCALGFSAKGQSRAARLVGAWCRGEESLIMETLEELVAHAAAVHDVTLLGVAFASLELAGADMQKVVAQRDYDSNSLLHLCAASRASGKSGEAAARLTARSLLKWGLVADTTNACCETPLMLAVRIAAAFGPDLDVPLEPARTLLEALASPDAMDQVGVTPLMWASRQNSPEVCNLLLQHGATPLQPPLQQERAVSVPIIDVIHEVPVQVISSDWSPSAETHREHRSGSVVFTLSHEEEINSAEGLLNQMELEDSYDVDWTIETTPSDAHSPDDHQQCLFSITESDHLSIPEVAG